jgi:hypothetical protein
MRREDLVRELDFIAATETRDAAGRRLVPAGIDVSAFRASPAVLLEHSWQREVGRVIALRLKDGALIGSMRVLAPGLDRELDALGAALLAGSAGLSVGLLPKPGQPNASWLEEISLVRNPGCKDARITAVNPFEWRPRP